MVMEAVKEDMGEGGTMQCLDHPYKNHTPGGICAFCLQEKLGKLVSSSFPIAVFPSASSSPSPSFRSDSTISVRQNGSTNSTIKNYRHYHQYHHTRRVRIPFFADTQRKDIRSVDPAAVFKRSKSTTTSATRRSGGGWLHFMDSEDSLEYSSPRKRGFWSFLRHNKTGKEICYTSATTTIRGTPQRSKETQKWDEELVAAVVDENAVSDCPHQAARVSRSRSVGCGSRSFSGDFFERISTGFGDCTLRRVESQREGKSRATPARCHGGGPDCIKERAKCGGIFSGFMITSNSSSSYWVSSASSAAPAASTPAAPAHLAHGRSKNWVWAFASPIRAFSKTPSVKREGSNKNTSTPNLNANPSLLTVGS